VSDWLKIRIVADRADASRIEELFDVFHAESISVENASLHQENEAFLWNPPLWSRQAITGLFYPTIDSDYLITTLKALTITKIKIEKTWLSDRDWIIHSQQKFTPIRISKGLKISPDWSSPICKQGDTVWITPGLAFGTGKHATTFLCLRKLSQLNLSGMTILDWGSGSGILSIAALKLGADRVFAIDIDHRSLVATRDNAKRNGMQAQIDVFRPEDIPENFQCDLIMANLLARPLKDLASKMMHYLDGYGQIIASGILESQIEETAKAFGKNLIYESVSKDGWAMITISLGESP
tara:strand:- start:1288 stop:2172 length:885 start_codon:yes stop_codon:yes gene_type:complete